MKRSSCRTAISARTTAAMVVNGFESSLWPAVATVAATYARAQRVSTETEKDSWSVRLKAEAA
jgi:hypothetical protein